MAKTKFSRFQIEMPDGSRSSRTFRTKTGASAFKKLKSIKKGKVIKVTFTSVR